MALPRVSIFFENGNIGSIEPSADGVVGILVKGTSTAALAYGVSKPIFSLLQAENDFGITEINNAILYNFIKTFYEEAGNGAELWVQLSPVATSYADLVNVRSGAMANAAKGRLRCIMALNTDAEKIGSLFVPAQTIAEQMTTEKYAPIIILLHETNVANIEDLKLKATNRVGCVIAENNEVCAVTLGRIAKSPVQRHVGRVKDGALKLHQYTIDGDALENYANIADTADKAYIIGRTFTGRSGYFIADDHLACPIADDYHFISRRRTADKAYRIAYTTLLNELNDEVPINNDGTIQAQFIKSWQGKVDAAIVANMTAFGELSVDETDTNDKGVKTFIDVNQNVVQSGIIECVVKIRPFGYAKYIDVKLGFTVTAN